MSPLLFGTLHAQRVKGLTRELADVTPTVRHPTCRTFQGPHTTKHTDVTSSLRQRLRRMFQGPHTTKSADVMPTVRHPECRMCRTDPRGRHPSV
ncbi:hypothetical protein L3X38_033283 [Prunus dulcis]|uniref:Uncharacterized protein n=1 Tax=Prunus dulcis TaxID=3755 RepID=A0AAD4VFM6_PRUDU|nr:hypothetical protein L3X38_033283 [Prunus dulcis]